MYLLDVSIRYLKYFCVLFVLFVFLFMLLALLRCYTSIFDGFISRGIVQVQMGISLFLGGLNDCPDGLGYLLNYSLDNNLDVSLKYNNGG